MIPFAPPKAHLKPHMKGNCGLYLTIFDRFFFLDVIAERGAKVHRHLIQVWTRPFPDKGGEGQIPWTPGLQTGCGLNVSGSMPPVIRWLFRNLNLETLPLVLL